LRCRIKAFSFTKHEESDRAHEPHDGGQSKYGSVRDAIGRAHVSRGKRNPLNPPVTPVNPVARPTATPLSYGGFKDWNLLVLEMI